MAVMDKIIDNLCDFDLSPSAARIRIVKDRLLKLNMKCKGCGMVYKSEADMEKMSVVKYSGMTDPDSMTVFLECECGHEGTHTFRPNPFILSRSAPF